MPLSGDPPEFELIVTAGELAPVPADVLQALGHELELLRSQSFNVPDQRKAVCQANAVFSL